MSETKIVPFYGDQLQATQDERGQVFAALKPMCEALGLDSRGQQQRIQRQAWAKGACVIHAPSQGGKQQVFMVPLRIVPMWLATITASRVREEVRPKLAHYQREAADVLAAAFLGPAPGADPVVSMLVGEVRDLRNQMWGFFQGALQAQEHRTDLLESATLARIVAVERQLKQLKRGARVSSMGRSSGKERKPTPQRARPLLPAHQLELVPKRG